METSTTVHTPASVVARLGVTQAAYALRAHPVLTRHAADGGEFVGLGVEARLALLGDVLDVLTAVGKSRVQTKVWLTTANPALAGVQPEVLIRDHADDAAVAERVLLAAREA